MRKWNAVEKNKVIFDQEKYRLGTDDYLSALMDRSKNLKRNIDTYNDKLKSINSKYRWLHIHLFAYKNILLLLLLLLLF